METLEKTFFVGDFVSLRASTHIAAMCDYDCASDGCGCDDKGCDGCSCEDDDDCGCDDVCTHDISL